MNSSKEKNRSLLGVGLYSVPDASRLTNVNPNRIRRWVEGYRYLTTDGKKSQDAIFRSEIPKIDGVLALSFNDILEIQFVNAFREIGVSMQKIRRALDELRKISKSEYPFSQQKVVTDGFQLFARLKDKQGNPLFYNYSGGRNYALTEITVQLLIKGFIFNDIGRVARWFPDKKKFQSIVVDPAISFGRPIVDGTGIPVTILADAYNAESSFNKVASWYEISPALVQQAVEFHDRFYS